MSLTALAWLACFGLLALFSLFRPAWGVCLYMLSFYLSPAFWWWGDALVNSLGDRFNIVTALIFAVAVLINPAWSAQRLTPSESRILKMLLVYGVNAIFVHVLLASDPERSYKGLDLLWKQIGLLYLIISAVRAKFDYKLFVAAILMGSLYIGYEVVVNNRGNVTGGRLEGIGTPGAAEANYLAGLMSFAIPLAGYWLFFGTRLQRLLSVATLVLVVELILRCNSRGTYLAIIASGAWLLLSARGRARKFATYGVVLGGLAVLLMAKNEQIYERFTSIFVSAEERDESAESRLDYWKAAAKMIMNNPLGSGAEAAFKSPRGVPYLRHLGIDRERAVHNGYLDITASWGIQGIALYLATIFMAWRIARRVRLAAIEVNNENVTFLGACLEGALVGQLVVSLFISSLDGEWFFWWFALAVCYERLYGEEVGLYSDPAAIPVLAARSRGIFPEPDAPARGGMATR